MAIIAPKDLPKFTFHYELIITSYITHVGICIGKFTFHYELIITIYKKPRK